jgi:AraC-like DNA-binding protein
MRFRRVLSEIEARRPVGWADLAAACGYYDQSHFIQEFRGFSGMNPGAYLRSRGEYLGYLPL